MDIDDENENNESILSTETKIAERQLPPENSMHQMYSQSTHTTNALPQDLNTALNMIFPSNETCSVGPSINPSVNSQVVNPMMHQHLNMPYDVTNNLSISPERKKKKNAPSQRKRRHLKKIMGKEDDDDDKLDLSIIQGPKVENTRKSNGNESEGDELAMLGIDAEDMAAQYY